MYSGSGNFLKVMNDGTKAANAETLKRRRLFSVILSVCRQENTFTCGKRPRESIMLESG